MKKQNVKRATPEEEFRDQAKEKWREEQEKLREAHFLAKAKEQQGRERKALGQVQRYVERRRAEENVETTHGDVDVKLDKISGVIEWYNEIPGYGSVIVDDENLKIVLDSRDLSVLVHETMFTHCGLRVPRDGTRIVFDTANPTGERLLVTRIYQWQGAQGDADSELPPLPRDRTPARSWTYQDKENEAEAARDQNAPPIEIFKREARDADSLRIGGGTAPAGLLPLEESDFSKSAFVRNRLAVVYENLHTMFLWGEMGVTGLFSVERAALFAKMALDDINTLFAMDEDSEFQAFIKEGELITHEDVLENLHKRIEADAVNNIALELHINEGLKTQSLIEGYLKRASIEINKDDLYDYIADLPYDMLFVEQMAEFYTKNILTKSFESLSKLPEGEQQRIATIIENRLEKWDSDVPKTAPELYADRPRSEDLPAFLRRAYGENGFLNGQLTTAHMDVLDPPCAIAIRAWISHHGTLPGDINLPGKVPRERQSPRKTRRKLDKS